MVLPLPQPADECLRRLAAVTTDRGVTWYLDSRTAQRPDPRFRGSVSPSFIHVARFSEAARRNSFVPWLEGQIKPTPDGGAVFTGRVGPDPAARVMLAVTAGVATLLVLAAVASGVSLLVAGDLGGLAPAVLIPFGVAALAAGVAVAGRRYVARETPRLLREVNTVLDATAPDI